MIISELPPGTAVLPMGDGLSNLDVIYAGVWLALPLANIGDADWPQPQPPTKIWLQQDALANVGIGDWPGQGTPTKIELQDVALANVAIGDWPGQGTPTK